METPYPVPAQSHGDVRPSDALAADLAAFDLQIAGLEQEGRLTPAVLWRFVYEIARASSRLAEGAVRQSLADLDDRIAEGVEAALEAETDLVLPAEAVQVLVVHVAACQRIFSTALAHSAALPQAVVEAADGLSASLRALLLELEPFIEGPSDAVEADPSEEADDPASPGPPSGGPNGTHGGFLDYVGGPAAPAAPPAAHVQAGAEAPSPAAPAPPAYHPWSARPAHGAFGPPRPGAEDRPASAPIGPPVGIVVGQTPGGAPIPADPEPPQGVQASAEAQAVAAEPPQSAQTSAEAVDAEPPQGVEDVQPAQGDSGLRATAPRPSDQASPVALTDHKGRSKRHRQGKRR